MLLLLMMMIIIIIAIIIFKPVNSQLVGINISDHSKMFQARFLYPLTFLVFVCDRNLPNLLL